jgi:uncharacterized protein DUF5655
MSNPQSAFSLNSHFENKEPIVRSIYDQLLKKVRQFGQVIEDPKKTSIHLVNAKAFAGVATRKNSINLTIKSDRRLPSSRIHRTEQASKRRFHHEVKLTSPADVDAELLTWLKDAYALSG